MSDYWVLSIRWVAFHRLNFNKNQNGLRSGTFFITRSKNSTKTIPWSFFFLKKTNTQRRPESQRTVLCQPVINIWQFCLFARYNYNIGLRDPNIVCLNTFISSLRISCFSWPRIIFSSWNGLRLSFLGDLLNLACKIQDAGIENL